jgi:ATP-dependent phosphoenolpyruvate carboxykinase
MLGNAWRDKAAYDEASYDLRNRFEKNFERFDVPAEIKTAGPRAQK